MVDILFALVELFAVYYGSGVIRRNVYSSAIFTGVDLFAFKFYLDMIVPINHSWHQKTRDTGLPDGEDRVPLRSLVLRHNMPDWGGQTDGYAVLVAWTYTAFAKLDLRHAVKIEQKNLANIRNTKQLDACDVIPVDEQ